MISKWSMSQLNTPLKLEPWGLPAPMAFMEILVCQTDLAQWLWGCWELLRTPRNLQWCLQRSLKLYKHKASLLPANFHCYWATPNLWFFHHSNLCDSQSPVPPYFQSSALGKEGCKSEGQWFPALLQLQCQSCRFKGKQGRHMQWETCRVLSTPV